MGTSYSAFSDPSSILRDYLVGNLKVELATLNGIRQATLKTIVQNYNVPGAAVLKLAAQNGVAVNVPLTAGASRTAAQIVTDIANAGGVPNLSATVDTAGRVVLQSTTAPTAGISVVTVSPDATGANLALGLPDGGAADKRQPLVPPTRAEFFPYDPPLAQARLGANRSNGVGSAMWMFIGEQGKLNAKGPKSFEHDIKISMDVADTAEDVNEIHERLRFYARAVDEIVANDRHLATLIQGNSQGVVYSEVAAKPDLRVKSLKTGGGSPIGTVRLEFSLRIFDSN